MQQERHRLAATRSEIQRILGPVDDDIIVDVVRTGATSGEVAEAFEWLNDDDYMGAALNRPMNEHVRRVYELLQSERDRMGQGDD
ncbi:MAG: hypothetical protein PHW76_09550 [Alphaproteobacteria bacterium]|nr:hypothetical protein [Alphaproteobacteria bacterium]